jgi:hypothetical protein
MTNKVMTQVDDESILCLPIPTGIGRARLIRIFTDFF